ncbi:MAG: autotransporter domain-containing protein [Proteobacteria bacterium]|nr:autotransporter domain-containing protein [Pseudomonadota bacterium]
MNRMFKILSATTAIAAIAAPAYADVFSTSQVAPVFGGTGTTQPDSVSGATVISTTGSPAFVISGTNTTYNLSISSSATLRSNSISGTIGIGDSSAIATFNLNNSGTIINTGAANPAISVTEANTAGAASANVNLRNTGTISGSILVGNGTGGILTLTNTGGTITGNVTTGAGADVITMNGGSLTGNVALGGGNNSMTVSGSTVTGNVGNGNTNHTMGLDITNGGSIVGNVTLLNDDVTTLNINNGSIIGNLVTDVGADIVTITNGNVSGTINLGGTGANTFNTSGTSFTTRGAGSNIGTWNVSNTTTTMNHAYTGVTTMRVNNGSTVNVSNTDAFGSAGIATALNVSGTLNVGAGSRVSATLANFANGGVLGINVASSTSAGQLVHGSAATAFAGASYTINVANTSGFIASGTTFKIVDGSATIAAGSVRATGDITNASSGVYRFSVSRANGNEDISLTIGRVATDSIVSSESGKAVAKALDSLGVSATGTLLTVQGLIGSQTSEEGVNNVIESLTPGVDGLGAANVGMSVATGNQVSNRLASLRGQGVATGSGMASKHMWVEGFGTTAEQKEKDGTKGYDANGGGISFGADTDTLMDGYTVGASLSYGAATVESNSANNAETDINSYIGTIYGGRVMDDGMFVNGQVALGFNQYEGERTVMGVGTAKSDFDGMQGSVKVEAGKDMAMDGFTVTPMASLQYTHLNTDDYTETGAAGANLVVDTKSLNTLDVGLGGQVAYAMPMENGGTLKPMLRAKYIYRAGDENMETTSRFTGGGAGFDTKGIKTGRSSAQVGAGLLLTTAGGVDFSVNYDADIRSKYLGHTGQLKARFAF